RDEEQRESLLQARLAVQEENDGDGADQPNRQQRVAAVAPNLRVGDSEEEVAHARIVQLRTIASRTRCAPLPLVGRGWGWESRDSCAGGAIVISPHHPPPQPSPTRGEGAGLSPWPPVQAVAFLPCP